MANFSSIFWVFPYHAFRFKSAIFVSFLRELSAGFRPSIVRNKRFSLYKWAHHPAFFRPFFAILAIFCPFVDHFRFFLNLYDIAGQA
jgi:hypothetical protein